MENLLVPVVPSVHDDVVSFTFDNVRKYSQENQRAVDPKRTGQSRANEIGKLEFPLLAPRALVEFVGSL